MKHLLAVATICIAASSHALAQDVEKFSTIEKAVEAAKKAKKDILVNFDGSDW